MNLISPKAWVGWTAVIMVIVLAMAAGFANGTHKTIKAAAWVLAALVAVTAAWNSVTGKD